MPLFLMVYKNFIHLFSPSITQFRRLVVVSQQIIFPMCFGARGN